MVPLPNYIVALSEKYIRNNICNSRTPPALALHRDTQFQYQLCVCFSSRSCVPVQLGQIERAFLVNYTSVCETWKQIHSSA